ncbi:uncharacterized protein FFFS_15930 [Fusarium fujikuroi]|nr:uncharacterized protein FFFS_15930 [Fusarium fujikuroi]
MINQAIAESLKTTSITQACTTVQNIDRPKPLLSLKDSLPHGEKDNSSSYVPLEVAGPAGSEDSDEGARLDELRHEELINNGMTFAIWKCLPWSHSHGGTVRNEWIMRRSLSGMVFKYIFKGIAVEYLLALIFANADMAESRT